MRMLSVAGTTSEKKSTDDQKGNISEQEIIEESGDAKS